ncbi:MAG: phage holin family protein [Neisseriaceae bacterium]|nr:phage holin family protein [Neisseriaceae bacterium]MBP6862106.1 phage holin family protein [Neisseriaceae bacterium]
MARLGFGASANRLLSNGLDLLFVRVQMARLEMQQHKDNLVAIVVSLILVGLCALVAAVGFLLGLNAVLPPVAKIWVFFGLAVVAVVVMVWLLVGINARKRNQKQLLSDTLLELKNDLSTLKGRIDALDDE